LAPDAAGVYFELGDATAIMRTPFAIMRTPLTQTEQQLREGVIVTDPETQQSILELAGLDQIVQFAVIAVLFFFVVLLVGFAYEWRTGALDWVRAVSLPTQSPMQRTISAQASPRGSVLSK
jgi:NADH-ubiquinone/plastoquinone oxidoreductase, chain 3